MSYALRFKGFSLILNTALPFALILGAAVLFQTLYSAAKSELAPPARLIAAEARTLAQQTRATIGAAQTAISVMHTEATNAGQAVAGLVAPLTTFNVQVPPVIVPVPTGIECSAFKTKVPRQQSPHNLRPIPAGFHGFELPDVRIPGLPNLTPGRPLPGTPAPVLPSPVLPRPTLPGPGLAPALDAPPGCTLVVENLNLTSGISAAINQALANTFAEPRRQFQAISTSIETTLGQVDVLTPLASDLRAQTAAMAAHAQTVSQAYSTFMSKVANTLRIAFLSLVVLAIWLVISSGGWALDRLILGWHLLRHGRYP